MKTKPREATLLIDGVEKKFVFWSTLSDRFENESAGKAYLDSLLDLDIKPKRVQILDVKTITFEDFFHKKELQDKEIQDKKEKHEEAMKNLLN